MHHILPPLPYDAAALEPHIDAHTMRLHHDKHHATYVDKLNQALQKARNLQQASALWLMLNLDKVPETLRGAVRQNAGGHVNHSLFWRAMKPGGGTPDGELATAIDQAFGSFRQFQARFEEVGAAVFGSGWVWLVRTPDGRLEVMATAGHDHPLMQGYFPVLLNDAWEHAYYLRYENRRPDYLKAWWSVVDWDEAARRFALFKRPKAEILKEEETLVAAV